MEELYMKHFDFNGGWFFYKENQPDQRTAVTLPHDAMIYEERKADCLNANNTGYFPGGKYVYEKTFRLSNDAPTDYVAIEFEGVYRNAQVWINDELIANHEFGYMGFLVDITNQIVIGKDNTLRVFVDNSEEPNNRWYSGSGIYRPVHLLMARKERICYEGIHIHTLSVNPPEIIVKTSYIKVADDKIVRVQILDNEKCIAEGSGSEAKILVPGAVLWSDESPKLYKARICLTEGEDIIDEEFVTFGIRNLEWNTNQGLLVNGKETLLRGACLHHDNGILGACSFRMAEERKIRILKKAGFNAIRSAHNPCSKALLDACDKYGMYVMDELYDQWYIAKLQYDYALCFERNYKDDIRAMIEKDYNHPCVVIYSMGNEVSETGEEKGIRLFHEMQEETKKQDDTRLVTCGINLSITASAAKEAKKAQKAEKKGETVKKKEPMNDQILQENEKKNRSLLFNLMMNKMGLIMKLSCRKKEVDEATTPVFEGIDLAGYNYGTARYKMDGKLHPERLIVGTETLPPDIYVNWKNVKKYPYLIGDFIWSGFEYLGETGIGAWTYGESGEGFMKPYPWILSGCGVIDILGNISPQGYYAKVAYGLTDKPYIGVRPLNHTGEKVFPSMWRGSDAVASWSWKGHEGKSAEIEVYSNAAKVVLALNNRVIGKKRPKKGIAKFKTLYKPGELVAVAYDEQGNKIGSSLLRTAGEEDCLKIRTETDTIRANGQDLAYIDISITDRNGTVKMMNDYELNVSVDGPVTLQGFGNAALKTVESYTDTVHSTFQGRALVVVRATEKTGIARIIVNNKVLGLKQVEIKVEGV